MWFDEKKLIVTSAEFEAAFVRYLIFEVLKAMRRVEFYSLQQGDLLVVDFEQKFATLSTFFHTIQLLQEEKTHIFKNGCIPGAISQDKVHV